MNVLQESLDQASQLIQQGRAADAILILDPVAAEFPQIGAIQWLLGHAYTRLTESMRAVEHYQSAYTLDANFPFVEFMENGIEFQLADIPGSDSCVMVLRELYEDIYGLKELKLSPGDIVIDVGAHVGAVSIFLGKRFPDVRILAYEPCRNTFGVLQDNIRRNNVANVESFNLAISGNGRDLRLLVAPHKSGMANAFVSEEVREKRVRDLGYRTEVVASITLDAVFRDNGIDRCAFMKLDCEGAEFEIVEETRVLNLVDELALEIHAAADENQIHKGPMIIRREFEALVAKSTSSPPKLRIASIVHVASN